MSMTSNIIHQFEHSSVTRGQKASTLYRWIAKKKDRKEGSQTEFDDGGVILPSDKVIFK